jgi:hypothetical protein
MEPIDIKIEYPSGLQLVDRAGLSRELALVNVSARLQRIVQLLDETEAPPLVTAIIDGQEVELDRRLDGAFSASLIAGDQDAPRGVWARLVAMVQAPTKDQRQQFGRFCHSVAVASLAGAVGYWHSTDHWDFQAVFNEAVLIVAFVLTFYQGLASMKGE